MNQALQILVLEDEQQAGDKLMELIKYQCPNATLIWKRSVVDGTAYLKEQPKLDLIFSDIELLDGNAFNIFKTVEPACPIIFCTAYDKFYVEAFKTNGIAYLLKPYTKEELSAAFQKYNLLFGKKEAPISTNLLNELKAILPQQQYKTTFAIKKRAGVFLLKTEDITFFQANGDFVLAVDQANKKHVLNQSLSNIEASLHSKHFFRINRSEIVHLTSILKYNSYTKNRLAITLKDEKTVLYTSNSRAAAFRTWIESL